VEVYIAAAFLGAVAVANAGIAIYSLSLWNYPAGALFACFAVIASLVFRNAVRDVQGR